MLSELAFPHIRCCLSAIPSDLMKSTAVDESLSSVNQQFCSRENQLLQMLYVILLLKLILVDLLADLPPPPDLPVDLNGNFRCLPLELI